MRPHFKYQEPEAPKKRTKRPAVIRANKSLKAWAQKTECVGLCVQSAINGKLCPLGTCHREKYV